MSIIDFLKRVQDYEKKKEKFLQQLEKSIEELKRNRPNYQNIAQNLLDELSLRMELSNTDKLNRGQKVIGVGSWKGKDYTDVKGKVTAYSEGYDQDPYTIEWSGGRQSYLPRENLRKDGPLEWTRVDGIGSEKDYQAFCSDIIAKISSIREKKKAVFNTGDAVEVVGGNYAVTKDGSRGHVTRIVDDACEVKFSYLEGGGKVPFICSIHKEKLKHLFRTRQELLEIFSEVKENVEVELREFSQKRDDLLLEYLPGLKKIGYDDEEIQDIFSCLDDGIIFKKRIELEEEEDLEELLGE